MNTVRGSVLNPDAWIAYTPTYSSDIGNAAATFSGGLVTTTKASALKSGKTVSISFNFSALTIGVTPAYIKVSLPVGVVPIDNVSYAPAVIKIAGTWETGQVRFDASGFAYFYRANQALFPAATTLIAAVNSVFEIA